jgi:single-strand DNA-binding protein
MASVNKVILVGSCGQDCEVRYTATGKPVANVSIATSSKRKDKQTGEKVDDTTWHKLIFFDKLAEIAGQFLTKGTLVYVEGQIKHDKYVDKNGQERSVTNVICQEMTVLKRGQERDRVPDGAPKDEVIDDQEIPF